ncbi:nucleoside triphosphate pyrophosphohydrolase [Aeromicrobium phragmitis]|uniref:Nucleoside triphosphate pyrophosphohydrolase n=1 Tax=Aeromicrobium phragmitis TaxID=2478914 RepID=A0A3L8PPF9_9ACTN|nr:MazG family protein [Aeromicrobium phragmitis]RLV56583.1 nucleoside triphosphate pyrophosphohydrolase [Aeromicrobium phragmitis]
MSDPLRELVDVMARLRAECPWTREQTHETLRRYLIEEAYETLEALDAADSEHLREELGDLLMQVVFHAEIAATDGEGWGIDEVAAGIRDKLVHRNPHVFGDVTVNSAAEVDANWQRLKAEKKRRSHPAEGIPEQLPALMYADKVLGRVAAEPVASDEIGDRLLAIVAEARAQGVDAEAALKSAARRHADRG